MTNDPGRLREFANGCLVLTRGVECTTGDILHAWQVAALRLDNDSLNTTVDPPLYEVVAEDYRLIVVRCLAQAQARSSM